jgi:hypothetical protein
LIYTDHLFVKIIQPMTRDSLGKTGLPIPFELHLTSTPLDKQALPHFLAICAQTGAKPLLIELAQGDHWQQAMASKQIHARHVAEAAALAKREAGLWSERGLAVWRIKIEVQLDFAARCQTHLPSGFSGYFEWHGKLPVAAVDSVRALALEHGAHLSANALKNQLDQRFLTLREYGNEPLFRERVAALVAALQARSWPILRQQFEFCVYDDNQTLDHGWLVPGKRAGMTATAIAHF